MLFIDISKRANYVNFYPYEQKFRTEFPSVHVWIAPWRRPGYEDRAVIFVEGRERVSLTWKDWYFRWRMPYGLWTCADGREVLYNREYRAIWERSGEGRQQTEIRQANPREWVDFVDQRSFHGGSDKPKRSVMKRLEQVLANFKAGNDVRCHLDSTPPGMKFSCLLDGFDDPNGNSAEQDRMDRTPPSPAPCDARDFEAAKAAFRAEAPDMRKTLKALRLDRHRVCHLGKWVSNLRPGFFPIQDERLEALHRKLAPIRRRLEHWQNTLMGSASYRLWRAWNKLWQEAEMEFEALEDTECEQFNLRRYGTPWPRQSDIDAGIAALRAATTQRGEGGWMR